MIAHYLEILSAINATAPMRPSGPRSRVEGSYSPARPDRVKMPGKPESPGRM